MIRKTLELFGEGESPILIADINKGEIKTNCGDSAYDFVIDIKTLADFMFEVINIYAIYNHTEEVPKKKKDRSPEPSPFDLTPELGDFCQELLSEDQENEALLANAEVEKLLTKKGRKEKTK